MTDPQPDPQPDPQDESPFEDPDPEQVTEAETAPTRQAAEVAAREETIRIRREHQAAAGPDHV